MKVTASDMTNQEQTSGSPKKTGKTLLWIVLLVIGFVAAFFTFRAVKAMVASWEITDLPGLAIKPGEATSVPVPGETPAASEDDTTSSQAPQLAGPTPEPCSASHWRAWG